MEKMLAKAVSLGIIILFASGCTMVRSVRVDVTCINCKTPWGKGDQVKMKFSKQTIFKQTKGRYENEDGNIDSNGNVNYTNASHESSRDR